MFIAAAAVYAAAPTFGSLEIYLRATICSWWRLHWRSLLSRHPWQRPRLPVAAHRAADPPAPRPPPVEAHGAAGPAAAHAPPLSPLPVAAHSASAPPATAAARTPSTALSRCRNCPTAGAGGAPPMLPGPALARPARIICQASFPGLAPAGLEPGGGINALGTACTGSGARSGLRADLTAVRRQPAILRAARHE